jgi:hypothetical protein
MGRWLLLLAFAAVGCGDDGALAPDLAAPSMADLGMPDLAGTIDASGFCEGTSLAGTCAQSFFAHLAECFPPVSGACVSHSPSSWWWTECWESGARISKATIGSSCGPRWVWANGATFCMDRNHSPDCASNVEVWTIPQSEAFPYATGPSMLVDTVTGDVTCPDGTHANIGPDFGNCAALHAVINTLKLYGQCPWDYNTDLGITCSP